MQLTSYNSRAILVHILLMAVLTAGAYYLHAPNTISHADLEEAEDAHMPDKGIPIPDFASIQDVDEKKKAFFDFLQPYIDAKNAEVRKQRLRLQSIASKLKVGVNPGHDENVLLWDLARKYDVKSDDLHDIGFISRLLHRVDVLPPSLVLAQAANESAWGTSRFAQEGNNLFGQWCYTEGCGLVPANRSSDIYYEVKSFSSVEEAINAYFRNLNTFQVYQDLRVIRQSLREEAKPIDGISLTEGLGRYSSRGAEYIHDLKRMIYKNDLLERDRLADQPSGNAGLTQGTENQ